MHTSTLISDFVFANSCWYDAFQVHVILLDVSFQSGSHTSAVPGENLPRKLMMPKKACSSFLFFGAGMSVTALIFCGSGLDVFP